MIAAWMLHATLVAFIIALASLLAERAAHVLGRSTRFIWLGALGVALSLSAGRLLLATFPAAPSRTTSARKAASVTRQHDDDEGTTPASPRDYATTRAPLDVVAIPQWLSVLDRPLLALWFTGSAAWAFVLVVSADRLRRQSSSWRQTSVDGVCVHVSENVGPALFGIVRREIVMPSWALRLDLAQQQMILAHEREHARAGDPMVLLTCALFVLLQPWNPVVWLMYHRLRFAVEADCDTRVLSSDIDVRAYGELLLDVGARAMGGLAPMAALSEVHSILERRISLMTRPPIARPRARSTAALIAASALVFIACQMPRPSSPAPTRSELAVQPRLQAGGVSSSSVNGSTGSKRTIVKLTSLGLLGVGPSFTILVFADGPARVGIGNQTLAALTDTLRLSSLPAMRMDVTEGAVHLRLAGRGSMQVAADVTGGPASHLSASGQEIIILKGGFGVRFASSDSSRSRE